jgi:hypothetical protein
LSSKIKAEKQAVDAYNNIITPNLIDTYKELQDVGITAVTASDYTMSGIENEQPEDLQSGIRFFNQATSLLADSARKLEQVAPQPTAVPNGTVSPYTPFVNMSAPNPLDTVTSGPNTTDQTIVPGTPAPITPISSSR